MVLSHGSMSRAHDLRSRPETKNAEMTAFYEPPSGIKCSNARSTPSRRDIGAWHCRVLSGHASVLDALTAPATCDIGSSSWFCGRKSGAKREFGEGLIKPEAEAAPATVSGERTSTHVTEACLGKTDESNDPQARRPAAVDNVHGRGVPECRFRDEHSRAVVSASSRCPAAT